MKYIDELLTETIISAPGCPDTLVERAIRVAATEFYRDTQAWRVTLDTAAVIAGRREVELDFPSGTFPIRYFWARLDGKVLDAVSERNIQDRSGTPRGYAVSGSSSTVQLDVVPEQTYLRNGLVVHAAVAPLNTQDEIPDELYVMHRNGILYGAQRTLLAMPNVPWGDLRMAGTYSGMAEVEKTQARRSADGQQSPVVRKVRYGGI